jgi:hypothetical protein
MSNEQQGTTRTGEKPFDYHPADNWYKVEVQHDEYTFEDLYRRHVADIAIDIHHALDSGALAVKVTRV